ncbi:hypothetical protein D3C78_1965440 [compost metagenome]
MSLGERGLSTFQGDLVLADEALDLDLMLSIKVSDLKIEGDHGIGVVLRQNRFDDSFS